MFLFYIPHKSIVRHRFTLTGPLRCVVLSGKLYILPPPPTPTPTPISPCKLGYIVLIRHCYFPPFVLGGRANLQKQLAVFTGDGFPLRLLIFPEGTTVNQRSMDKCSSFAKKVKKEKKKKEWWLWVHGCCIRLFFCQRRSLIVVVL